MLIPTFKAIYSTVPKCIKDTLTQPPPPPPPPPRILKSQDNVLLIVLMSVDETAEMSFIYSTPKLWTAYQKQLGRHNSLVKVESM